VTRWRLFFWIRDHWGAIPVLARTDGREIGESGMYAADNMGLGLRSVRQ
jgi:hypothetical protein